MLTKSKSANDTDNAIVTQINQCRIGTSHTADYIAPRRHYHCLQSADGHMSLQLLSIDQSRLQCEQVVQFLATDKKLWRGRLKQICRRLYDPNVSYPLSLCYEVNQAICRNMTDDEILSFGCMASHIDDVIQPELVKLSNSVFLTMGKQHVPNQSAMTKVISCYLYCMVAKEIISRCRELQRGSWYLLCRNPLDASSRSNAYSITNADIERMLTLLQLIIKELAANNTFQVPYTDDMANGVTIICSKMTDVITIWQACVDGGINAGHKTFAELEAELERKKAARIARNKETIEDKKPKEKSAEDLSAMFSNKGWTVKTA